MRMLLKYDLHETARYMGYKHGAEPSEEICELIEEVQKEIYHINDLIVDAASYDYCPSYFK